MRARRSRGAPTPSDAESLGAAEPALDVGLNGRCDSGGIVGHETPDQFVEAGAHQAAPVGSSPSRPYIAGAQMYRKSHSLCMSPPIMHGNWANPMQVAAAIGVDLLTSPSPACPADERGRRQQVHVDVPEPEAHHLMAVDVPERLVIGRQTEMSSGASRCDSVS